jgi:hypothetical protein
MKIARYKFVRIAIFVWFVFPHAGIAIPQTDISSDSNERLGTNMDLGTARGNS